MSLSSTYSDWDEVKALLGESTNNYFLLVTSSAVNKWSRCKPVRDVGAGANWPGGGAGQRFGFDLSSGTWDYLKPRGGSYGGATDEPARLDDFRGYNHTALPTFHLTTYPGSTQLNVDSFTFVLTVNESDITVEDLLMSGYYFTVKIGSTYYTAAFPLSSRGSEATALSIHITGLTAGTYTWESYISSSSVASAGTVIPLPSYDSYVISGSCTLTLVAPSVTTINNTSINGTVSAYIYGSTIRFTGFNMDMSDFYFKMYDNRTGDLLGSDYITASTDGVNPGTRVGTVPGISAPSGWGSSETIRFEDY